MKKAYLTALSLSFALATVTPALGQTVFKTYLPEKVRQFDPIYMSSPAQRQISQLMHQGLVKYSPQVLPSRYGSFSQVVPALAKSWQEGIDHTSYIFRLHPNARFHNGRKITAADVKYSFERACNPRLNSSGRWAIERLNIKGLKQYQIAQLNQVKEPHLPGVEILDHDMIQLHLEKPVPYAMDLLSLPYFSIVPREDIERRWKPFNDNPVGAGPYRYQALNKKNSHLSLKHFQGYFDQRDPAQLEQLSFAIMPKMGQTFEAFQKKSLDHTKVPPTFFKKVIQDPLWNPLGDTWIMKAESINNPSRSKVIKLPRWQTQFLNMDNQVLPFDNKKVRQAFNFAVDKREITLNILHTYARPVTGVYPPGFPGATRQDFIYKQNLDKARKLLYEAGWRDRNQDGWIEPWQDPSLILTLNYQNTKVSYKICKQVQTNLAKIGVKINLAPLRAGLRTDFYHSSSEPLISDASHLFYRPFYSHSAHNTSHYHNPMVDKSLNAAEHMYEQPERYRLYQEAERHIIEDAPLLWLYNPVDYMMVQSQVKDYQVHPLLPLPYQKIQVASNPSQ